MKKALMFSNFGSWEDDQIGPVGIVDFDPNADVEPQLKQLAETHGLSHVHENDVNEAHTKLTVLDITAFNILLAELQMDWISDVPFNHMCVVRWSSYVEMIIGIIIIE